MHKRLAMLVALVAALTMSMAGNATAITGNAVSGRVTCDDNGGTYCDDGVGIYSDSRQQSNEAKGDATDGTRFQAWCKKDGTRGNQGGPSLFATTYNNNKRSTWWVQITYEGTSYIPFIWINLDNGDDIAALPSCP